MDFSSILCVLHILYGLLIYSMRATCYDPLTFLDLMAVRTSYTIKLFVTQFSPTNLYYSLSLRSKYSLDALF
jgi:hypothetical protein